MCLFIINFLPLLLPHRPVGRHVVILGHVPLLLSIQEPHRKLGDVSIRPARPARPDSRAGYWLSHPGRGKRWKTLGAYRGRFQRLVQLQAPGETAAAAQAVHDSLVSFHGF